MSLLQFILYVFVAVIGAGVVFTKNVVKQLFVYSMFGGLLTLLFFSLQAPDVALSELAVGSLAVPLMVLIAIMKTGGAP